MCDDWTPYQKKEGKELIRGCRVKHKNTSEAGIYLSQLDGFATVSWDSLRISDVPVELIGPEQKKEEGDVNGKRRIG